METLDRSIVVLITLTKLLNDMADAGEQEEELLLKLFNSLQPPAKSTRSWTPYDPPMQRGSGHLQITINGRTYRPDPSEIRKVPPRDDDKGLSKSLRATSDATTFPPIGFLKNPLSGVLGVLRGTMSNEEQVALKRSGGSEQQNHFRLSQETLSALSELQLDEITRSRLALVGESRPSPALPNLAAILEEADHLERLLTRPSSYLLITLRNNNTAGLDSLDDLGKVERLTMISRNTYLCKTLENAADTLSEVKQLDTVYWAGYYMKGFILAEELLHAEPELRWWCMFREEDPSARGLIGRDPLRPLSDSSRSQHILVDLVPHDDVKMQDFIPAVRSILQNDRLSPAHGSTSLRTNATLEQLVALTSIDGLYGIYKVGIIEFHGDEEGR